MAQIKFYITVNVPETENKENDWNVNDAQDVLEDCFMLDIKQYGFELIEMEIK